MNDAPFVRGAERNPRAVQVLETEMFCLLGNEDIPHDSLLYSPDEEEIDK